MNFVDRFFLFIFLSPKKLYNKLGVDFDQLRAVLVAKLTMDNRRVVTLMANNRKKTNKPKANNKSTLNTMIGSLFMGLFMLYVFAVGNDTLTKLTFFNTMFLFVLTLTLITDFTSVLMDVRDNLIILPKPISDRTFLVSRLLHIIIRVCMIVMPLTLPGLIALIFKDGFFVLLPFVLMVLMMSLLSIFFINAAYLVILKITTPEKFKSIISSIQIVFVIFFMAFFQLMPRLMMSKSMQNTHLSDLSWIQFYPPYWFSQACLFLSGKAMHSNAYIGLILAILIPLISIWLVIRYFAPTFNQKLALIAGGNSEKQEKNENQKGLNLHQRIGRFVTKSGTEYAGFLLAWNMMTRSRDLKMRVYPQLGYIVVFGVVFFFQNHNLNTYLILITYFSTMVMTNAIFQLPYSDKHKASWILHITPVTKPGYFMGGALKAVLVMFYLPIALALFIFGYFITGTAGMPSLLLGVVNMLAITMLYAFLNYKKLPFSEPIDGMAVGNNFIRTLYMLLPPVLFGLLHLVVAGMIWVVVMLIVISAVIAWLLYDEIKRWDWLRLKR